MAEVNESVRRVVPVKFVLGLFDNPYLTQPEVTAAVPEHPLVRQAAEESFVLLQNKSISQNPVLPIAPNAKIALTGPLAGNPNEMQGSWAAGRKASDVITLKAALQQRRPLAVPRSEIPLHLPLHRRPKRNAIPSNKPLPNQSRS